MKQKIIRWSYYIILAIILIFGIYIRTKLYILSDVFEDDECRLALGMMDKSLWQMFLPLGSYSSTPIFVFISKIIAEITKYNEYALHFIPFIFSLASIGLFYKICAEYLNKKISLIIALFLFVVNYDNIYFSSIFKTYSLDVFIALLCLYYFPKIDILELKAKHLFVFTTSIIIFMLTALPSLFFIGTFFLVNIYKHYKDKLFYKKFAAILIPFALVFGLYYFFNLLPTKILQMHDYKEFWNGIFSAGIITTITATLKFLFRPNTYTLFSFILLIIFAIRTVFNKNERKIMNIYLLSILLLSIFASYIGLYPIALGRTALYLLPVLIMVFVKTTDFQYGKRIYVFIVYIIFIVSLQAHFMPKYIYMENNIITTFRNYAPKSLMQDMIKRFNHTTDKIVTTNASMYSYTFYAIQHNFIQNWNMLENKKNTIDNAREIYFNYYNNLDKNKNYWFYLIKEYPFTPQLAPTLDWIAHQNVLYSKQERGSYLYYISGIKEVKP